MENNSQKLYKMANIVLYTLYFLCQIFNALNIIGNFQADYISLKYPYILSKNPTDPCGSSDSYGNRR